MFKSNIKKISHNLAAKKYREKYPQRIEASRLKWLTKNWEKEKIRKKRWHLENPTYRKEYMKEWNKRNKPLLRQYNKLRRARRAIGGRITIKIIQRIYEDNIKKFGTLTCIYCLEPIQFGQDSIEHKIPVTRGGTNKYRNLAVACIRCNRKKNNKTPIEFGRLTELKAKL